MRVLMVLWAVLLWPAGVAAAVDAEEPVENSSRQPLVLVPAGCETPELPEVAFVGTVIQRDFRTVRWEIRQVRAGDPEAFGPGQQLDVRYGLDAQFLEVGEDYLVSTRRDPFLGVLVSQVSVTPEVFGGADVVGLAPTQVECPPSVDVARTFHTDGAEISTAVLSTMAAERTQVISAVLLPLGVLVVALFLAALIKLSVNRVLTGPRWPGGATH